VGAVALPEFFDGTPMVSNADAIARPGAVASKLRRQGVRVLKARINALQGAALGGAMSETVKRVQAVQQPAPDVVNGAAGANGGLIPITTDTLIARATVVNDQIQVVTILRDRIMPNTLDYTTDLGLTNGRRVVGDTDGSGPGLARPLLGIDHILGVSELG